MLISPSLIFATSKQPLKGHYVTCQIIQRSLDRVDCIRICNLVSEALVLRKKQGLLHTAKFSLEPPLFEKFKLCYLLASATWLKRNSGLPLEHPIQGNNYIYGNWWAGAMGKRREDFYNHFIETMKYSFEEAVERGQPLPQDKTKTYTIEGHAFELTKAEYRWLVDRLKWCCHE